MNLFYFVPFFLCFSFSAARIFRRLLPTTIIVIGLCVFVCSYHTTIYLYIAVKPTKVKIVSANNLLVAGKKTPLRCEAWGSAPPGLCLARLNFICAICTHSHHTHTLSQVTPLIFISLDRIAKITWLLDGVPILSADITSSSDSSDEVGICYIC